MNENNPIFQSLAMIEERIREKLTVGALAESIHFSKYHYQRMFREAVGDSVMGYVARRRMSLAAGELAETNVSVLEIALKYGYDSHEGFTRGFKAYMGVTPTEYRKYQLSANPQNHRKENCVMMYSKATDEINRELNRLIVEAMETAAEARKYGGKMERGTAGIGKCGMVAGEESAEGAKGNAGKESVGTARGNAEAEEISAYAQFWEFSADRAEKIAGQIKEILESVVAVARRPDEISARFLIIKAVEYAAYEAGITAFQTGLTVARALPEHRKAFQHLCDRYDALARHARISAGRIAAIFHELSALIFQDMRQNGQKKIESCVEAGRAAAKLLSDPALPYTYIAEEILGVAEELAAAPLEEVTLCLLEDASFRLEAAVFAADVDIWRQPRHRHLFDGISNFRARLEETLEFFRGLSEDAARALAKSGEASAVGSAEEKMYHDLAAQESLLMFYLKGEIRKLGDSHLSQEQKLVFETICGKLGEVVSLARHATGKAGAKGEEAEKNGDRAKKAGELLREVCEEMLSESRRLGIYGGAIQYIAEEAKVPLKYLPDYQGDPA